MSLLKPVMIKKLTETTHLIDFDPIVAETRKIINENVYTKELQILAETNPATYYNKRITVYKLGDTVRAIIDIYLLSSVASGTFEITLSPKIKIKSNQAVTAMGRSTTAQFATSSEGYGNTIKTRCSSSVAVYFVVHADVELEEWPDL
jgi:hypothetical protein